MDDCRICRGWNRQFGIFLGCLSCKIRYNQQACMWKILDKWHITILPKQSPSYRWLIGSLRRRRLVVAFLAPLVFFIFFRDSKMHGRRSTLRRLQDVEFEKYYEWCFLYMSLLNGTYKNTLHHTSRHLWPHFLKVGKSIKGTLYGACCRNSYPLDIFYT